MRENLAGPLAGTGMAAARPETEPGRFPAVLLLYGAAMVLLLLVVARLSGTDYVGPDNDDVMRLVEVRNWLAGQSWFDMTEYRLGLDGGTLMHWSRFVDLPIGLLIRFFSLFTARETAEAWALCVWPVSLAFLLVVLAGLAGYRLGGRVTMHLAAGMAIFYVYGMGRFMPGSADHHNVQLTLATLVVAMLADPRWRPGSLAAAGMAAGMGLAIGAESAPFVAAACAAVSLIWAWKGEPLRRPVSSFALAFVATVTAAFFLTTPPHLYHQVTCDNLSLGFYALASIGGFLLFLETLVLSRAAPLMRLAGLALLAAAVLVAARIIAPQCLGNPLASLDPMLTELWLGKVVEARSIAAQLKAAPSSAPGFYLVGALGLAVCLIRIVRGDRAETHVVLFVLLAAGFGVSLIQVRGAMFSNLLAIFPLSLAVADLRRWQQAAPERPLRSLAYLGLALASVPLLWSLAGLVAAKGMAGIRQQVSAAPAGGVFSCASRAALAPLEGLPAGVVMAPSDLGVHILRFTPHRVLSAPYHRDQGGMLTELNAGLVMPDEALAFLRGARVNYVLFCPAELQTRDLARLKPAGFYGRMMAGQVPPYLERLNPGAREGLQIYAVRPQ